MSLQQSYFVKYLQSVMLINAIKINIILLNIFETIKALIELLLNKSHFSKMPSQPKCF